MIISVGYRVKSKRGILLWLTIEQIALLVESDRSVISKHIKKIYEESELEKKRTCAKNAQVQIEGNRQIVRYRDI